MHRTLIATLFMAMMVAPALIFKSDAKHENVS